jgi:hypothetical protein
MNWKLPDQLRQLAGHLAGDDASAWADVCNEAAAEIELMRGMWMQPGPIELPAEEGDRANG